VRVEVDLVEEIGVNSGEEIVVEERGLLRIEERDWIVEESLEKDGEEVEEDVEVVRLRWVVDGRFLSCRRGSLGYPKRKNILQLVGM
jgi:hypothetical protein